MTILNMSRSAAVLIFVIVVIRALMQYKLPVQIRQSDKIAASLTYGLFRPVVLLPKAMDWTQMLGEGRKSAYARTLIGLEEEKRNWTPLVNKFSRYAIEERINAIMKLKKTSFAGILLAIALVIGTTASFATSAASAAEEKHTANASAVLEKLPHQSIIPEKDKETPPEAEAAVTADKNPSSLPQKDLEESSARPSSTTEKGDKTQETASSDEGADAQTSTQEREDSGVKTDDGACAAYPVNQNGETYGNDLMAQDLGYEPDLIAATGTGGQDGYVREEDLQGPDVTTPEEAVAYMENLKALPPSCTIPLYDQEGNVIGEFRGDNPYSGGNQKHYDSLEEARAAVVEEDEN